MFFSKQSYSGLDETRCKRQQTVQCSGLFPSPQRLDLRHSRSTGVMSGNA